MKFKTLFVYFSGLLSGLLATTTAIAQGTSNEMPKSPAEYSMNVTHVLTRFAGNRSNLFEANETFLFSYKTPVNSKAVYLRLGFNGDMQNKRESTITSVNESKNWFVSGIIGWEKRKALTPSFSFFYGGDFHVFNHNENVRTFIFINESSIHFNNLQLGGAGVFGLYWHPSPRIRLFTESYLRASYFKNERKMVGFDGTVTPLNNKEGMTFFLLMPQSIHLSISF